MEKMLVWMGLALALFCAAGAKAGEEEWNPPSVGPLTTWPAPVCASGSAVARVFAAFNRARGFFDGPGPEEALGKGDEKYSWQTTALVQYGLAENLELSVLGGAVENSVWKSGAGARAQGMADTWFFGRYCLAQDDGWVPCASFLAQLKAPTGKYQDANPALLGADITGTGSWDLGAGASVSKKLRPFWIHADLIATQPFQTTIDNQAVRWGSYANLDAAVESFLPWNLNLLFEANQFFLADRAVSGNEEPGSWGRATVLGAGLGWSNDKIQTLLVYQRTVRGFNTDALDGVVLALVGSF